MNAGDSDTNEYDKICCYFTDKFNLKNPNENFALVNLRIHYTWNNIKLIYKTANLRYLAQHGILSLIDLMDHIPCQISKCIVSTLLRNMRL